MAGEVRVPVFVALRDNATQKLQAQLGGLNTSLSKFGAMAGKAVAGIASLGAALGANFLSGSIDQAKNLERSLLSVNTVFGQLAPRINSYSKNLAGYGLSQSEAAKASVFLGSVLKQSGFSMEETATQTEKLVKLGADLSATYGYDVQEALLGMTALFRGEYDPIEKFGVAMKQSEINSELAARGQDKLTGAARRLAEQQIRLELLFQRSQDAQGAFARGSGTLYVETERLRAVFENMQMSVGRELTPAITTLMEELQGLIPVLGEKLRKAIREVDWEGLVTDLADVAVYLVDNLDALIEFGKNIATFVGTILAIKTALELVTVAQTAFNVAAAASPYLLAASILAAAAPLILEFGKAVRNSMTDQQKASEDARSLIGRQKAIKEGFEKGKKAVDKYAESFKKLAEAIKNFNYTKVTAPAAFGLPGQMGLGAGAGAGTGEDIAGGAAKETESQFKKVQKVIKDYQSRLNQAEEQYLRQKYELNRDYENDVKKLREAEARAQENLLIQSAKQLSNTFANSVRFTFSDLVQKTKQTQTTITQLSSRLSLSVSKEVEKTTTKSVADMIDELSKRITSARNLIKAASDLTALGFTQTFIEQVVETGAEAGVELANAIVTASPEQQEALKRNFLELETVTETGIDGVAKTLTDKFGLATRELQAQSKDLADELDAALKERALTLKNALEDAAWSFSNTIALIRKEFTDAIAEFDMKLAGLNTTIEALLGKMSKLGMTDVQKQITGEGGSLQGATISDVAVAKNTVNAAGLVIDSASDVASTAAYVAARIAAANKYIASTASNATQDASAKAQIKAWTEELTQLQTAAKQGQNVAGTVININVKTDSTQSVAMVGKTLGKYVTTYTQTGGKVLVSGTK